MQAINSVTSGAPQTSYDSYIMDPTNELINMRQGGRGNQSVILTYEDNTEWVFLSNKPQERFCGFLYLQNALKESDLNTITAAENKITIHDKEIIYLSQYCGEKRPGLFGHIDEFQKLNKDIGFTDMLGSANLRERDDKIYVFDTEKGSFDNSVHEKIDTFVKLHNAIRSSLEEKLK